MKGEDAVNEGVAHAACVPVCRHPPVTAVKDGRRLRDVISFVLKPGDSTVSWSANIPSVQSALK